MRLTFDNARLQKAIRGRRLSIREAAQAAGMTELTMQRLAYGKYTFCLPRLPTLQKLSATFNVPVEEWLIKEEKS